MMKLRIAPAALLLLLATLPLAGFSAPVDAGPGQESRFRRIITVVLENTDYEESVLQPFLASLMEKGAAFTNFHAETHPSQANYVAMIAGTTKGVPGDGKVNLAGRHIGDLLEGAQLNWKVYAEDFPGNCFLGMSKGDFVRRHVPFLSFLNVQRDPARCARVVGAEQFDQDAAAGNLPEYSLYVPNLKNDGHDTSVAFADKWLAQKFGAFLADPGLMDGTLFVVTFDESESLFGDENQVLTVLFGPMVRAGVANTELHDHYSLLRLVEDNFQLGSLQQKDAQAAQINGIWQQPL